MNHLVLSGASRVGEYSRQTYLTTLSGAPMSAEKVFFEIIRLLLVIAYTYQTSTVVEIPSFA